MVKTRPKSIPLEPSEIAQLNKKVPDTAAHFDYVTKLLEWCLNDFDHLILIVQHRLVAEKAYVNALAEINRLPPPPIIEVLPFEGELTFTTTKAKFKANLDRTIADRVDLIETMSSQLDVLLILKGEHESKKRRIKTSLARRNTEYLVHREKVLAKQRSIYMEKYAELEQEDSTNNVMIATAAVVSEVEESSGIESSESTTRMERGERRKSRTSLQQIRQHLASKTVPVGQSNKVAKLKHKVMEADRDYRHSVAKLEQLREDQIKMVKIVHENIKMMFIDKTEITKSALRYMFVTEQSIQGREAHMLQALTKTCGEMDGRKDGEAFSQHMKNLKFAPPNPVCYEHYKHGQLKDAQFGVSLEMYSRTHGGRNVPVLVSRCIEAVEEMGGLQREGIYRISGRHINVDALRLEFEKDEQLCDLKRFDLFTVASVLKVYLRELEGPLWVFPMGLRDDYSRKDDDTTRLRELETRIGELTVPHHETLQVIIKHLARIGAQADKNRMTIQNLAYIFTPAIFHDEQQSHSGHDRVLIDLITHHKSLFAKYDINNPNLLVQEQAKVTTTAMVSPNLVAAEEAQLQPRQSIDSSHQKYQ